MNRKDGRDELRENKKSDRQIKNRLLPNKLSMHGHLGKPESTDNQGHRIDEEHLIKLKKLFIKPGE